MAGLYIHIPFRRSERAYDEAYTTCLPPEQGDPEQGVPPQGDPEQQVARYVTALRREIAHYAQEHAADEPATTLYLGGGRPSLLSLDALRPLLDTARACTGSPAGAPAGTAFEEATLELCPADATPDYLEGLRAIGIDRVHLSVLSFFPGDLSQIGAPHSAPQGLEAVRTARTAGFEKISVELLFGWPGQTMAHWAATLEQAVDMEIPHISVTEWTAPEQDTTNRDTTKRDSSPRDASKPDRSKPGPPPQNGPARSIFLDGGASREDPPGENHTGDRHTGENNTSDRHTGDHNIGDHNAGQGDAAPSTNQPSANQPSANQPSANRSSADRSSTTRPSAVPAPSETLASVSRPPDAPSSDNDATPDASAPNASAPNATAPNATAPNASTSNATTSNASTSNAEDDRSSEDRSGEIAAAKQFSHAMQTLAAAGYQQYELTHFARDGHRSLHQGRLYDHGAYLGVGASARSLWWPRRRQGAVARRWANVADTDRYAELLQRGYPPISFRQTVDFRSLGEEYLALRVRTDEGVDLRRLKAEYGLDLRARHGEMLETLTRHDLIAWPNRHRFRLTRRGRLVADGITERLVR